MKMKLNAKPFWSSALGIYWTAAGLLSLAAVITIASMLHWGERIRAAETDYSSGLHFNTVCAIDEPPGSAGRYTMRSQTGVPYTVITPTNYQARYAHPLLVVFAPAGFGPGLSERFSGLTQPATEKGFVVAYVSSGSPLSKKNITRMSAVAKEVSSRWCIAPGRVYATGHSDGGTVSMALAALDAHQGTVNAIASSGAGWQDSDFFNMKCPPKLPVMIMHGANDSHFPGFGRDAAHWWSSCNGCDGQGPVDAQGCRQYTGCGAETLYCETSRSHWRWAGDSHQIMDFLSRQAARDSLTAAP